MEKLRELLEDDDRDTCSVIHESLWVIGRFAIARESNTEDGLNHLVAHFKEVVDELFESLEAPTVH